MIFVSFVTVLGLYLGLATAATHNTKHLSAPVYQSKHPILGQSVTVPKERLHKTANLSYRVAGKRYYPLQKVAEFSQTGSASFYGGQFHGRRTTSGEIFNKNALTAAHPTLPIPSYARVTNLKNGKSVVVRINDRGPFHGNRIIDVSQAAAEKLSFVRAGTAQVRVEQILPSADQVVQKNQHQEKIYVDLQEFKDKQAARDYLLATTRHLKQAKSEQTASLVKVKDSYVVRMGPFLQQNRAEAMKKMMSTTAI